MANIVPFESGTLPAYLKSVDVSELNQDLTSHASSGFPIMSIKHFNVKSKTSQCIIVYLRTYLNGTILQGHTLPVAFVRHSWL